ncbi:hypothetical protein OFC18_33450, partial [Escherichia coli]|nr:hypothetical protein [Escherichia coli]
VRLAGTFISFFLSFILLLFFKQNLFLLDIPILTFQIVFPFSISWHKIPYLFPSPCSITNLTAP